MAVEATLFKEVEPTLFKFKRSTALFAVYSTFFFGAIMNGRRNGRKDCKRYVQ
jgi:hypothetical protein